MSDAALGITRRTMGLSVPVTELLDPDLWLQRYAHGITLGVAEGAGGSPDVDLVGLVCRQGSTKAKAVRQVQDVQSILSERAAGLPRDTIRWHLRAAASELEQKLRMPLGLTVYKSLPVDPGLVRGTHYDAVYPRQPLNNALVNNWFRVDLPGHVLTIDRIRAFFFDQVAWEISADKGNLSLIKLEHPKAGSGHLLPSMMANLLISADFGTGTAAYGPMQLFGSNGVTPDVWAIDFTAGPRDQYGAPGEVEAVLAHWVYCVAGILLLSIGGLAKSQGLTSASVSMDGLSRSVGLQASAIYGINSALENALEKAAKRIDWKALRTYKSGLQILPYGR